MLHKHDKNHLQSLTLFDAKLWLCIGDLDTISGAMGPFASKNISKRKKRDSHYKKCDHFNVQYA